MKLPRPLSHSSISMYLECPQKWKFKYVDKLPEKPRHFFAFGQSVHLALEYFYGVQSLPAPSLKDLLGHFGRIWVAEGYRDAAQEAEYKTEGRRILTEFHRKHVPDFRLPFFAEYGFQLEVDGVPVTGKVDRIDKQGDGSIAIVDYKTGKAFPLDRVRQDAQLTMYQMACEELLGLKVSSLTFYHLPTLTPLTVDPHPPEQVRALRARIKTVAQEIEADRFAPAPEERKCGWCDFRPHCPVFKHMYVTHHEAPAAPEELDGEIQELVDRLGQVQEQIRELKATARDLEEQVLEDMRRKGTRRAFGERYQAEMSVEEAWEFADKEAVKSLLKSFGFYDRILVPSATRLRKFLAEETLPPQFMDELGRLGRRVPAAALAVRRSHEA